MSFQLPERLVNKYDSSEKPNKINKQKDNKILAKICFCQVHAVFLNEQYNDPDEAKAKSGGVTVIAVQVQVGV